MIKEQNGSIKTQIEQFATELIRLNTDITPADRLAAMQELDIKSHSTLSNYLNGKGRDNDTAAALIVFFKNRISRRDLVMIDNVLSKQVMHG